MKMLLKNGNISNRKRNISLLKEIELILVINVGVFLAIDIQFLRMKNHGKLSVNLAGKKELPQFLITHLQIYIIDIVKSVDKRIYPIQIQNGRKLAVHVIVKDGSQMKLIAESAKLANFQ